MLIDLHAHSAGISHCCRAKGDRVIREAKAVGIDGIVLTNHYTKNYVKDEDYAAFARRYTEEYEQLLALGEAEGIRVLFGVELTMEKHDMVHLLLYGVEPSFVEESPMLFDWTQQELYERVHAVGGIVVQAHPYRKNVDAMLDLAYLDGIELSCHPKYEGTHEAELYALAQKNQKALTCGGDYHADTHRPRCGVYLPQEITTPQALAQYLANAQTLTLCVQETVG